MKKRLSKIFTAGLAVIIAFTVAKPTTVKAAQSYDVYDLNQAEDVRYTYDSEIKTEGDVTYLSMQANDCFGDYYFLDKGYKSFEITYRAKTPTSISARIYREGGPSFMYFLLESTGGEFVTKTFDITYPMTRYDYDLTFTCGKAALDIDSFKFNPAEEEVTEEPIENPVNEEKTNTVNCTVNSWSDGGSANVEIINETDVTTDGWKVKIKKGEFKIDSFWCANMEEDSEYYIFTPYDWNKTLQPGNKVQFGFNMSGNVGNSIDYILE